MKNYYILTAENTIIATFDKQHNAYKAKETLQENSKYEGYIDIETHTVFESFSEWFDLNK